MNRLKLNLLGFERRIMELFDGTSLEGTHFVLILARLVTYTVSAIIIWGNIFFVYLIIERFH